MRRDFYNKDTAFLCLFIFIQLIYIRSDTHITIYIAFKLSYSVHTLFRTNDLVRECIMHTNNDPASTFITKCGNITKNAPSAFMRLIFSGSVIRNISGLAFLEFDVVFRLTHIFQLFYCKSWHNLRF